MLKIPKDTPRKSRSTYKAGDLSYYESLETEHMAKTNVIDDLQSLADRSLSQALKDAIDPQPDKFKKNEDCRFKSLYDFQDRRNAVSSPRWENELKAKFGLSLRSP
jgi:hypothetical protein